ncbi:hypothetical protein CRYUN_Cryun04dG0124000 [Craigia yunnanensis]
MYKLNVDAAYYSSSKKASLGMVVRDHMGMIHFYAVKRIGNVEYALHAKLAAILFGMEESRQYVVK